MRSLYRFFTSLFTKTSHPIEIFDDEDGIFPPSVGYRVYKLYDPSPSTNRQRVYTLYK